MKNSPRFLATGSSSSGIVAEIIDLTRFAIVNGSQYQRALPEVHFGTQIYA
jgi:hypothetical protein